jgi:hypothetical protein
MARLQIYWIPQVPMQPFHARVSSLSEAKLLLDTLARYDLFQLEHGIKPDFANAGGLQVFDSSDTTDSEDGSWVDWEDEDGRSIDELSARECAALDRLGTVQE